MSSFWSRVSVRHPIMQAPMAGAGGVDMALAALKAGCLGSLPAAFITPSLLEESLMKIKKDFPELNVNVNFQLLGDVEGMRKYVSDVVVQEAVQHERSLMKELEEMLPAGTITTPFPENMAHQALSSEEVQRLRFSDNMSVVLKHKPKVVSFIFGVPSSDVVERLKREGICVVGTVTSLDEYVEWKSYSPDALVVQGMEAGGHQGTFRIPTPQDNDSTPFTPIPRSELLQTIGAHAKQDNIPLIAAGGISSQKDVRDCLEISGVVGVSVGTALLLSTESLLSSVQREALRRWGHTRKTVFTRQYSGRWARGIQNISSTSTGTVLPWPWQNALTMKRRYEVSAIPCTEENYTVAEYINLWAGVGVERICRNDGKSTEKILAELVA
eukprot:PhF_6_TR30367/c0_g1_i4/m.44482/K00459/ncd2, npd; nitronate monooxygenase